MKVAELVEIGSKFLEMLSDCDIKTGDYKYVELYKDYEKCLIDGEKITYIVTFLSDKYKLSEASVYRILRRFKKAV